MERATKLKLDWRRSTHRCTRASLQTFCPQSSACGSGQTERASDSYLRRTCTRLKIPSGAGGLQGTCDSTEALKWMPGTWPAAPQSRDEGVGSGRGGVSLEGLSGGLRRLCSALGKCRRAEARRSLSPLPASCVPWPWKDGYTSSGTALPAGSQDPTATPLRSQPLDRSLAKLCTDRDHAHDFNRKITNDHTCARDRPHAVHGRHRNCL